MTTSVLQQMQALAAQAAEVSSVDITETGTGGGSRKVLDKGKYLGRMVEYIEKGSQKNTFEPSKPPRSICRIGFAVFPFEVAEDGTRSVSEEPVFIRTSDLTISNHEKAGLKRMYNRLNWRNDATKSHIAMFLGEPFFIGVDKRTTKDGKREYNTIDTNDISPAVDPMSGQPYNVPAVSDDVYRAFFWEMPTKESWDSLYIEGSTDDGKSKNFIQEEILAAVDYPGSPLEQLLTGASSVPLPTEQAATAAPAAPEAPAPEAPPAPEVPTAPAAPVAPAVPQV